MKIFLVKTDVCDMILTLKYHPCAEMFQLFLHGVCSTDGNGGIDFYEDERSLFVDPTQSAIFKAATDLVNYHFVWEKKNQEEFRSFLWDLWKECHSDIFGPDDRLIIDGKLPEKFWII